MVPPHVHMVPLTCEVSMSNVTLVVPYIFYGVSIIWSPNMYVWSPKRYVWSVSMTLMVSHTLYGIGI